MHVPIKNKEEAYMHAAMLTKVKLSVSKASYMFLQAKMSLVQQSVIHTRWIADFHINDFKRNQHTKQ